MEQKIIERGTQRWFIRKDSDDHLGPADHERGLEPIMRALMPEGGVFLDIGAHVGHWSIRLASKAERVIAVEPNPQTLIVLGTNIGLNGLDNVEVHPYAASDHDAGIVGLLDPNGRIGGGSVVSDEVALAHVVAEEMLARTMRIDTLDLARVDLVKIDVEGAEADVLRGMMATIERCRPTMVIEMHHLIYPGQGIEEDVAEALADAAYTHREVYALGESVYWLARHVESVDT